MDWITSKGLIEYQEALNRMESKVSKIINNERSTKEKIIPNIVAKENFLTSIEFLSLILINEKSI